MPKQLEISGTERKSIPQIDEAAQAYVAARDKRMALTDKEVAAKTNLIQVVLAFEKELEKGPDGVKTYRFDDELVLLIPGKAKVKVKAAHDDDDDSDED
jgi:hypothetical protein